MSQDQHQLLNQSINPQSRASTGMMSQATRTERPLLDMPSSQQSVATHSSTAKIQAECDAYAANNATEATVAKALSQYLYNLSGKTCQFCGGWGHLATGCSTKKIVDAACRHNPQWKVTWGSIKAGVVTLGKRQRATEAFNKIEADAAQKRQRQA